MRAIHSQGRLVVDPWVVDMVLHVRGDILSRVHEVAIVAVV